MINATGYMIYHQETDPKGPSGGDLVKSIRGTTQQSPEEIASTGANHGFIIRDFIGYLRPDGPVIVDSVSKMMKNFKNGPDKNWNKNVLEKFFVTLVGLSSPAQQILRQHGRMNTRSLEDDFQKVIVPNSIFFSNACNKKVSVTQQTLCDDFLTNPSIYNYVAMESLYNEGFNYNPTEKHMTDVKTQFMYKGVYELFRNNKDTVFLQERFANINPLTAKTSLTIGKQSPRLLPFWETNKMILSIKRHKLGLNSQNGMDLKDSRDIASLFKLDANPFVDILLSDKRNIERSFFQNLQDPSKLSSIDNLSFHMSPKLLVGNVGNYLTMPPNLREQMAVAFLNKFSRLISPENKDMLKTWERSLNLEKIEVPLVFLVHMYTITHTYTDMKQLFANSKSHNNMIDIAVYFLKKYNVVLGCTNLAVLQLYSHDTRNKSNDLSKVAKAMLLYVERLADMHINMLDAVISVFRKGNNVQINEEERYKMYLKYGAEISWAVDFSKPCIVPMTFVADNICGKVFCLSNKNQVHAIVPIDEKDPLKKADYVTTGHRGASCRKWVKVDHFDMIFHNNSVHQVVMNKIAFQLIEHLSGGRLALGHLDGDILTGLKAALNMNNTVTLPPFATGDGQVKIDVKTENDMFVESQNEEITRNVMMETDQITDQNFYNGWFVDKTTPGIQLLPACYGLMAVNSPPPISLSFDRNFRHVSSFSCVGLPMIPCSYFLNKGDINHKDFISMMDISYRMYDPAIVRSQSNSNIPLEIISSTDILLSPEYYAEHYSVHKRQYSMNIEAIGSMNSFSKACQSIVNNMYMTPIGFYCLSRYFDHTGFAFMLVLNERFETEDVINITKKSSIHRQGHPTLEKRHSGGMYNII